MKKSSRFIPAAFLFLIVLMTLIGLIFRDHFQKETAEAGATEEVFLLGNTVLFTEDYTSLYAGKRVGLLTNQTGVNADGVKTMEIFYEDPEIDLTALFAPEHGIDGLLPAGAWVENGFHTEYDIPVYSLHGDTRKPTALMLADIDVLFVDLQDIGARTYTFISTVQYAMEACAEQGKAVVILDRPNPLGGVTVEGPVMDADYITFVGCDILPLSHGMTMGELALYFNRNIGADLTVVPMQGYTREMIWQDTGLEWVGTSPNIPDIEAAFCYMATGMGENTGLHQKNTFKWVGHADLDGDAFAEKLNALHLPGITFHSESIDGEGGVTLEITDYTTFNPALTGLAVLSVAKSLVDYTVPQTAADAQDREMFEKLAGGVALGQWLIEGWTIEEMQAAYAAELAAFQEERQAYLLYE